MKRAASLITIVLVACSGNGDGNDDDGRTGVDAGPIARRDAGPVATRDAGPSRDASTNPPLTDLRIDLGGRPVGARLDFGARFTGEREAATVLTVTNDSANAVTLHENAVSLLGAAGEFVVTEPNERNLAPGASTTITVDYAPTALGRSNATVRVHHASGEFGPTTFDVSGYGQANGTPLFVGGGGAFARVRTTTGDPGTWITDTDRFATDPCPGLGDDHPRDLIRGIGYGDGTFVLVGGSCAGMLATSRDGIQWNASLLDPPYAGFYADVVYLDGVFVAVGGLGGRVRSTDGGESWTIVGDYSKCLLRRAAVGNGRIVTVGDMFGEGCYSSSEDGVTWTPIVGGGEIFQAVAYGNGLFVATGFNRCETSPDGVNWTPCGPTAPFASTLWFANGEFIAFGPNGVDHSTDGITWTNTPGPWLEVIAYGAGRYVGAGVSTRAAGPTLEGLVVEFEGAGTRDWVFGHAID